MAERHPGVSAGVLVPWDCQIVVPELPGSRRVQALRGFAEAQVCRSVSLIGFDLIPIVAAETVPPV